MKKKSKQPKILNCPHYKGDGFVYELFDKSSLHVCPFCNLKLSRGVMETVVIQALLPSVTLGDDD